MSNSDKGEREKFPLTALCKHVCKKENKMHAKDNTSQDVSWLQGLQWGYEFTRWSGSPPPPPCLSGGSDAWPGRISGWPTLGSERGKKTRIQLVLLWIHAGNVRLPTFCRYLATKARWESRCSLVSSVSPSFNRFSYSWKHWQPQETRDVLIWAKSNLFPRIPLSSIRQSDDGLQDGADRPGTPSLWPPSPPPERSCDCGTPGRRGSSAAAGGTSSTSPSPRPWQSWTPPAAAPGGNTREPSPLRWWPPADVQTAASCRPRTQHPDFFQTFGSLTFRSCMMEVFFGSLGSSRDCVAHCRIFFMSYRPDAPMYETASCWLKPLNTNKED